MNNVVWDISKLYTTLLHAYGSSLQYFRALAERTIIDIKFKSFDRKDMKYLMYFNCFLENKKLNVLTQSYVSLLCNHKQKQYIELKN